MSQQTPQDPTMGWVAPSDPTQPLPTETSAAPAAQIPAAPAYAPQVPAPQAYAPQVPAPQAYAPQVPAPQAYAPQIPAAQAYAPQVPAPQAYGGQTQPPPPPNNPWSSDPYAANPYARPAAGAEQHLASFPNTYAVPGPRTNASAIVLLVLSVLALLPTFLMATPATILAIVALSQNRENPTLSRRLTWIGWGLLALAVVIAGFAWWWIFAQASAFSDPGSDPYSY